MMYVYQLLNGLNNEYNLIGSDIELIKFIQKNILRSKYTRPLGPTRMLILIR